MKISKVGENKDDNKTADRRNGNDNICQNLDRSNDNYHYACICHTHDAIISSSSHKMYVYSKILMLVLMKFVSNSYHAAIYIELFTTPATCFKNFNYCRQCCIWKPQRLSSLLKSKQLAVTRHGHNKNQIIDQLK